MSGDAERICGRRLRHRSSAWCTSARSTCTDVPRRATPVPTRHWSSRVTITRLVKPKENRPRAIRSHSRSASHRRPAGLHFWTSFRGVDPAAAPASQTPRAGPDRSREGICNAVYIENLVDLILLAASGEAAIGRPLSAPKGAGSRGASSTARMLKWLGCPGLVRCRRASRWQPQSPLKRSLVFCADRRG